MLYCTALGKGVGRISSVSGPGEAGSPTFRAGAGQVKLVRVNKALVAGHWMCSRVTGSVSSRVWVQVLVLIRSFKLAKLDLLTRWWSMSGWLRVRFPGGLVVAAMGQAGPQRLTFWLLDLKGPLKLGRQGLNLRTSLAIGTWYKIFSKPRFITKDTFSITVWTKCLSFIPRIIIYLLEGLGLSVWPIVNIGVCGSLIILGNIEFFSSSLIGVEFRELSWGIPITIVGLDWERHWLGLVELVVHVELWRNWNRVNFPLFHY